MSSDIVVCRRYVLFLLPGEVEIAENKYEEAKTELEKAISEIQDI